MIRTAALFLALLGLGETAHGRRAAADGGIPADAAAEAFREADRLCGRDGGALWGVSLCGPLLLADPATRAVVGSRPDAEGLLEPDGAVFRGTLPPELPIANTAVTWAGVHWAMVMWPLPEDAYDRGRLLMHESWHRIQDRIGLPGTNPGNAHLETLDGRYLKRLEWRALARALETAGSDRLEAARDALAFRALRLDRYPAARTEERELLLHEGLAEYTGVVAAAGSAADAAARSAAALRSAEQGRTFARSFAYASGPAYGLLLDELDPGWRADIGPDHDLGDRLAAALGHEPARLSETEIAERARQYGAARLREDEEARDRARRERVARYRTAFIDGPILLLRMSAPRLSFHPHEVEPLGDEGAVYGSVRATDRWGTLDAPGGALVSFEAGTIRLPAPADPHARPLTGDGWTLELDAGWRLEPGERDGDFVVVRARSDADQPRAHR